MLTYSGKCAIVSGAGGGIGSVVSGMFAAAGVKVALMDISEKVAETTKDRFALTDEQALAIGCDITDPVCIRKSVETAIDHFGSVDYLVNCAGIPGPSARLEKYPYALAEQVFRINYFGTYAMIQNVIPCMRKQHFGAIVNFGSCSGIRSYKYEIPYGDSKAAVIHLTGGVAHEYGGDGIRCNCVAPGWCKTNMMRTVCESYKDVGIVNYREYITMPCLGRVSCPEEQANVVLFLCSDQASYVNGATYRTDGGMTLG